MTTLCEKHGVVLVIDVQQRLMPAMAQGAQTLAAMVRLAAGARLLDIPIAVSEQYPQGLGATVAELAPFCAQAGAIAKTTFSAWREPAFRARVESYGRRQPVLCGIEAHICVLQTALDMHKAGYDCRVAVDAITSRRLSDHAVACRRLHHNGIGLLTVESALFEWLSSSRHPRFKDIAQLVR